MKPVKVFRVALFAICIPLNGQNQQQQPSTKPEPVQEQVTVYATRTEGRLEDQPTRIELLDQEEVDEKTMMTPGNIVMMLNETSGLRVQTTSPSLGASTVRIQGMKGRYTRFLADGLPLFGQQGAGLGLLQTPPVDLGQVEIIKGVASALYGAGAMGGVVNLITRRPGDKPIRDFMVNQTTLGGTDVSGYLAGKFTPQMGGSMLGMGDWQVERDRNHDSWADLAGYGRAVVRPRLFWDNDKGRRGLLTGGFTYENRTGGTLPGKVLPATGAPYLEALESRRGDIGTTAQWLLTNQYVVNVRGSYSTQHHRHVFGDDLERDRHELLFGESSLRGNGKRYTWVAGAAFERDAYRPEDVPQYRYTYRNPGIFAQGDIQAAPWLSLSVSARADFHSQYGALFSPRVAALIRSRGWTSRLSLGQGFSAPSALTEETEAVGLRRLVIANPLKVERGRGLTFDLTRSWKAFSATTTLFASTVHHPLYVDQTTAYTLRSLDAPTENLGVETVGILHKGEFSATASYTWTRAREKPGLVRQDVELTPRHSAGLVGTWERENNARIGVEAYYTGTQRLDDNPYRTESKPYVLFGFLIEKHLGRFKAYLNAENLGDIRQTKYDPLLRPTRGVDGRWTTDAWAPLDGRVFNGGVRMNF
jgi:iron complex outermembrane receptor protein